MKVVYLTSRVPNEPMKGDQVIGYNQIKELYKSHKNIEIYLISLTDEENISECSDEILGYCKEVYFIKSAPKLVRIINCLKFVYNGLPMQVNYNYNKNNKKMILSIIEKINPDIIHVQTARVVEYVKDIYYIPKTIDFIDALSLNMKRRAEKENLFYKLILNIESKLMRNYEKKVMGVFDSKFIVSEIDKEYLGDNSIVVNSNGVKLIEKNNIKRENFIIFHGNMSYFPNIRAAKILINDIFPKVKENNSNLKLLIVGKDPDKEIVKHNSEDIIVTGFVDDVFEYLYKAKIAVFPLDTGTGMQNKVLEAFMAKTPVIASNFAVAGFGNITDDHFIRANTVEEYVKKINNLLNDDKLRNNLSEASYIYVKNNYSWCRNIDILIKEWNRYIK